MYFIQSVLSSFQISRTSAAHTVHIEDPTCSVEPSGGHHRYLTAHLIAVHLSSLAASSANQADNALAPVGTLIHHLSVQEHLAYQACILKQSEVIIDRSTAYPEPA